MFFSLALKNIFSRKSSLIIIIFMSFIFSLLFIVNNFFDGTEKGIKASYTESFTGDLIIRPLSKFPISLLGDNTPMTGEYTKLDILPNYKQIKTILDNNPHISKTTNQLSDYCRLQKKGYELDCFVFGIDGKSYFDLCSGIKILEGKAFSENEKGIMLSQKIALDANLEVGDFIEIIMSDGISVSIRSLPITAIYDYPLYTQVLEHIVLVNAETIRDLKNLSNTVIVDYEDLDSNSTNLIDNSSFDFDSLDNFFDNLFTDTGFVDGIYNDKNLINVDVQDVQDVQNAQLVQSSWNFIIGKVKEGISPNFLIRELNKNFKAEGLAVEAINWRGAAGATASYLYFLRLILNIGVLIILLSGFIIINNTLSIHVIDRTQEIGSIRAIGAKKTFIAFLFLSETFLLTIISSICALILGFIFQTIINTLSISLNNDFIIQLIGSSTIFISSSIKSVFILLITSIILTFFSWFSPVKTALAVSPLAAMRESQ